MIGPYVVTTKREPFSDIGRRIILSRVAVATLVDAQGRVHDEVFRLESDASDGGPIKAFDRAYETLLSFPESGGTVGPLPDGTVIEVEQISSFDLKLKALVSPRATDEEACDAFNAKEAKR